VTLGVKLAEPPLASWNGASLVSWNGAVVVAGLVLVWCWSGAGGVSLVVRGQHWPER
jgi:hypothetical protein